MIKENFGLKTAPRVFCKKDNKSLDKQLKSSKVIQDRRLRVDIARLQGIVKLGKIETQWVDETHHQLADPLTKYETSAERLMGALKIRKL